MQTRGRVLAALQVAGLDGVSGEAVARSLGVSRVAVAKHIAALRALGYTIEAHAGVGYRLLAAPDLALPGEVEPLVRNPMWRRFEGGPVTTSTNDDARTLAREGAPEGTVVVAGAQTAGRGRLGREWVSPEGGAYFSAVLRPRISPAETAPLSLVVALGVAKGLEQLGVHAGLKWPNDLLHGGGKLAGVLMEMSAEGSEVDWVVAGVGINVSRPDTAHDGASFLQDGLGERAVAASAVAASLDGIASAYAAWLGDGFAALRGPYEERLVIRGRKVVVSDREGTERASGTVLGVDDDGRLLVSGEAGVQAVVAGEVTLRR